MSKNVIKVTTTSENRYERILTVLSALMPTPLSDKEIKLVSLLYKKGCKLTTEARKEIREQLGISVEYMNNYVSRLRQKKIIREDDTLHPNLSSLDISDESKDYLMLFQFVSKDKSAPNEEHDSSDSGGSTENG